MRLKRSYFGAAQVLEDLVEALPTPEGSSAAARAWTAMGNKERADAIRAGG